MSTPARVLVSVLNYNAVDDTVETLRCLERQVYRSYDLDVTDNASTNDAVARIRAAMPNVRIVQNSTNTGYAGGMNSILRRGLAEGYDYVLLCNNDLDVPPDALAQLVATAESRTDAGVIGPVEFDYFSGRVRAVGGRGFSLWSGRCDWSTEIPAQGGVHAFQYVQGAMLMVGRRALEAGVLMDDRLFMYYEEADLGFQLRQHGLRAYVATDVHIRHKAQERYLHPPNGYYQQRNRVYLVRKYGRAYHVAFNLLSTALVELPIKVVVRTVQGHAEYVRACVTGFRDALRDRMGPRPPTTKAN